MRKRNRLSRRCHGHKMGPTPNLNDAWGSAWFTNGAAFRPRPNPFIDERADTGRELYLTAKIPPDSACAESLVTWTGWADEPPS